MTDYIPPPITQPIPYPDVLDPRTGDPFTAPAIADLHCRLREQLLETVVAFLEEEAGLDPWALEASDLSPAVHAALEALTSSSLSQELAQEQFNHEQARWALENPAEAFRQRVELLAAEAAYLNSREEV